jgi:hypothetical protein
VGQGGDGREAEAPGLSADAFVREPLAMVVRTVAGTRKSDPIGEVIDRILAAQAEAIEAAIARHGASPGCRLPGPGTRDRQAIAKLVRERLERDRRTEADCMHVIAVYRGDWLADPIALQKGWTRETPWRAKNFNAKLGADPSLGSRAGVPARPEAPRKRFEDAAVWHGEPSQASQPARRPAEPKPAPEPRPEIVEDWG